MNRLCCSRIVNDLATTVGLFWQNPPQPVTEVIDYRHVIIFSGPSTVQKRTTRLSSLTEISATRWQQYESDCSGDPALSDSKLVDSLGLTNLGRPHFFWSDFILIVCCWRIYFCATNGQIFYISGITHTHTHTEPLGRARELLKAIDNFRGNAIMSPLDGTKVIMEVIDSCMNGVRATDDNKTAPTTPFVTGRAGVPGSVFSCNNQSVVPLRRETFWMNL